MSLSVDLLRQSWFLAGPTACGKTATSLELAERINAEIISLDSMAIYRGLDIGTAKPDVADRARIPHHLVDVADPDQDFSVAQFLRLASDAAAEIILRGRTPLFVGGTGLYLRSALRGLFEGPEADWNLRAELERATAARGREWLHSQLREVDPPTADRLHVNDQRRIIRAIEVFRLTGRRLSDDQTQHPRPAQDQPRVVIWLDPPRDWLHQRIEQRVDAMIEAGWIEEARRLMACNPPAGRTAAMALGYSELIGHLRGVISLSEAVARIKAATRQFAKRQVTWFRNLAECRSESVAPAEGASAVAERIFRRSGG